MSAKGIEHQTGGGGGAGGAGAHGGAAGGEERESQLSARTVVMLGGTEGWGHAQCEHMRCIKQEHFKHLTCGATIHGVLPALLAVSLLPCMCTDRMLVPALHGLAAMSWCWQLAISARRFLKVCWSTCERTQGVGWQLTADVCE
jgi:hypothetical protein